MAQIIGKGSGIDFSRNFRYLQERFDFRVRLVVEGRVHRFLTLRVTFNPLEFDFSASHTRNLSSPRPLRARCSIFQRSLNLGAAANREGALKT